MDVGAVEWLENFLQTYEKTFVIISHDRYFLDRTCRRIIEIENGKAVSYKGNYSQFLVEREERREAQRRAFENQQSRLLPKTKNLSVAISPDRKQNWRNRGAICSKESRELTPSSPINRSGNFKLEKSRTFRNKGFNG